MGKSGSVFCGVTAPFSWVLVHTMFCLCPPRVCFPVPCKFWQLYVGLIVTSSKRAYAISTSAAPRAPAPAAVHCWPVLPQETLKHSSVLVSVGSLGPGAHKVCLSPLSMRVWVNSRIWWWTGRPGVQQAVHGVAKSWTRLSDWTELNNLLFIPELIIVILFKIWPSYFTLTIWLSIPQDLYKMSFLNSEDSFPQRRICQIVPFHILVLDPASWIPSILLFVFPHFSGPYHPSNNIQYPCVNASLVTVVV